MHFLYCTYIITHFVLFVNRLFCKLFMNNLWAQLTFRKGRGFLFSSYLYLTLYIISNFFIFVNSKCSQNKCSIFVQNIQLCNLTNTFCTKSFHIFIYFCARYTKYLFLTKILQKFNGLFIKLYRSVHIYFGKNENLRKVNKLFIKSAWFVHKCGNGAVGTRSRRHYNTSAAESQ